jgi:SAM-dependent methyltransferase
MELDRLQQHWTAFGEQDPLWAILTVPGKRGGGWDLEEFFASGRVEVDEVLRMLAGRGFTVEMGRALDFGCGVGRLTRALAGHFASCDGVDVAASMIERARELNQDGERVRFHHNGAPDLRLFDDGSFDFILSLIVLQHMEPKLMQGYLREFLRVLSPSGLAFFNIPQGIVLDEELPPEAWRASLTLVGTIPPLAPGRIVPLTINVRNDSSVSWPASAQVRVGNHWRGPDGTVVVLDDARTAIESAVEPGGECRVQLNAVAPSLLGDYELEVDLVQELIAWFADRGSPTLKVPVVVAADADAPAPGSAEAAARATRQGGPAGFVPQMELYVMPRDEVVGTLEDAGGVVLDVAERDRCGPAMRSFDYVVARAVTRPAKRSRTEQRDPQAVIEARIRSPLEVGDNACVGMSRQLLPEDRQRPERHREALRVMDERADLVGFGLTSALKGAGRASVAVRGVLRRALLEVLHRQSEHNRASDELIRSHDAQLEALGASVRAQLDIQAAAADRLAALERVLAPVEVNSVTLGQREARRLAQLDIDYPGFAESFRGAFKVVQDHQRRYVSLFAASADVVDVGCGRGEFLQLLREAGVNAIGVDRDPAMIARCRELGLDVRHDEAMHFLRGRPESSHGGVFAGHLVEHLEPGAVVELLRLAFSRLRPGGVLVIETVNPMCLLTHATFRDDVTRVGSVPPSALTWLAESCGFAPGEIEYCSPVPPEHKLRPLPASAGAEAEVEAFNRGLTVANDLLFGFQEYALVAHKPS